MSLATRARGRGPAGSASFPVPIRPMPECPQCRPTLPSDSSLGPRARGRPAVPGVLGPGPMSHRVYQVSRAIRVQVGGTAVLPSHPGSLGPGSEGPCVRQALPGKSRSGPMARGVDQLSGATRARVRGPTVSTRCSRPSGPGPRARRVHQGSRATRTRVRGPAGSTRSPGRVEHMPDAPRGQPDVPGDSGLAPRAHGVTQLSWDTRALDRRTAVSTS